MHVILSFLLFIVQTLHASSVTPTTVSPLAFSANTPHITHFLVFSSNLETVIAFEPKHGWILNDENQIHLHISGVHLHNSSIVFSATAGECSASDFVSPIYRLSSLPVIDFDVRLDAVPRGRSSVFVCLLTPAKLSSSSNGSGLQNGTQLEGPYFTFLRDKSTIPFAAKICLILMLFIVSGFFSGLNLGLMSLSVNDLRLIAESEDSSLRYYAKRVLPLRRRGNYLLCSIVLANVLVNSMGTVLLDSLVHGLLAVIGSTIMIVLMGEIIPQAICSRYGLVIGAHTHVITWTCMIVTGVISYPLGFILDKILGQEVTASYTRDQIAGMLTRINADIEKPEMDVITGVLSLRKKAVKEAMTWLPDVYMLDKDRKTDAELLMDVHKHGYSRIPVFSHDKSNVIGIVKLRDFALITPEQYHLTVKHVLEFHTHPFGYTKIQDSLYNLMQEFLKARWHIALVQELSNEEDNVDPVYTTVGVITLEDVIEEMLQREIIEEADFFTDNRRKIQRKQAKTMDYTALVKRPVKGPSISPQLKVAVFQFLSTNVPQFTSGFISQEILKVLLNYNVYAMLKRQATQSSNAIYLYKQGFRYELFTLVMQGNATLESGVEHIMSTVGPFSFFAASALLAEHKTVKHVHQFLDALFTKNTKSPNIATLLDEISSIFVPDYNLLVHSELHVLQIHRLVWLAAVRATQRQRGNDPHQRRMHPEQLLLNAFDEVASVTNVQIDKNNLTNFQRIFLNEKDIAHHLKQTMNGNTHANGRATSATVFDAIHSVSTADQIDANTSQAMHMYGDAASLSLAPSLNPLVCNPLLLAIPAGEQINGIGSNNASYRGSSNSTSLSEGAFNSSMHINRMFDDSNEQTIDHDECGQEKEQLIDQGRSINDTWQRQPISPPANRFRALSETKMLISPSPSNRNQMANDPDESDASTRPKRATSLISPTESTPS